MPYKAKLTTRQETTSQYPNTDNLAKGSELDFDEADSNFLNLRDQSIGIADDTSTVIDVGMGNTLTVTGTGGIATSVSGQTLTIDGTSVSGGGTTLGNLQVNDTDLSPITTNDSLTLTANGTGNIILSGNSATINSNTFTAKDEGGGDTFITANAGGGVELYWDNSKKFETQTYGADLTTGDLRLLDGSVYVAYGATGYRLTTSRGSSGQLLKTNGNGTTEWTTINLGSNTYYSQAGSSSTINLDFNNGNVQLREITGNPGTCNMGLVSNMNNGDIMEVILWNNTDGDPPESGGSSLGINIGNFRNMDSNDIISLGLDKIAVVRIIKIESVDSAETQILTFPGTLDVPSFQNLQGE